LFNYATPQDGRAYEVVAGDFVTLDGGTGLDTLIQKETADTDSLVKTVEDNSI